MNCKSRVSLDFALLLALRFFISDSDTRLTWKTAVKEPRKAPSWKLCRCTRALRRALTLPRDLGLRRIADRDVTVLRAACKTNPPQRHRRLLYEWEWVKYKQGQSLIHDSEPNHYPKCNPNKITICNCNLHLK